MGLTRRQAFPSRYMGKEDVLAGPIRVSIKNVLIESIKGDGGDDEDKVVLHWREQMKPMICNNTNWTTLEEAYGADTDGWIGKPVEVYHDPGIMFGGKRTGGTRLRVPSGAPVNTNPAQHLVKAKLGLVWADAVALAATVGMTVDQLKESLKLRGLTGYNSVKDEAVVREIVAANTAPQETSFEDAPPTGEAIPF